MLQSLINMFEELGLTYYRQGSLSADADVPSTFFTFWNYNTPYDDYANNQKYTKEHTYYVYCYSTKIEDTYDQLNKFIALAETNKWIIENDGEDVPSDFKNYCGRMIRIKIKENI